MNYVFLFLNSIIKLLLMAPLHINNHYEANINNNYEANANRFLKSK